MTEFRPTRPRQALRGTLRAAEGPKIHSIIGIAHLMLGALGVASMLMTLPDAIDGHAIVPLLWVVALGALSAASVLAGLWLADGRRRGAWLAVAVDGFQCVMSVLSGSVFTFGFALVLAMGIGALWLAPQLELPGPSA